MALPVLTKTWQFLVNASYPALGTALADNRTILKGIKDALKGLGSWTDAAAAGTSLTTPWTVRYSCDSSTAGTAGDGVDRWAAITNLVWANAGSAHSWFVLRNTTIASNFELLISCEGTAANGNVATVVISPSAAFTGGTTTARPTATDEIVLVNGVSVGLSSSDLSYRLHVMMSSDGQCTRIFVYQNNAVVSTWILEKPQNPVSGWTNPSYSIVIALPPTIANILTTAAANGKGASTMTMFLTCEGIGTTAPLASDMVTANDLDSNWPMFPVGLYSKTAANRGRHGNPFDLWYGLTAANDGDAYPGSGTTRQFAQIGDLIVPWNQTTPLTA